MDHTQFQIGELHSRFNIMRINLQCTNNNLNDLNLNYNCQTNALIEKINHLENKLNLYVSEPSSSYRKSLRNDENLCLIKNSKANENSIISSNDFNDNQFSLKRVMDNIGDSSLKEKRFTKSAKTPCPLVDKYSIPLRRDYTTICDDIIISDWISCKETPPASPTTSMIDLSQPGKSKRSNRLMKSKAKRNKLLSNKEKVIGDKEEELRQAEKIERDEMASVIVQRLRQLSHKQSYSSTNEMDDSVIQNEEIITSKLEESTSKNKLIKSSKLSSSLISFSDSKKVIRQHSTPITISNDLVIFKLVSDLN